MIRITTHQLPRIRHARQTSATPDTRGLQPNRQPITCHVHRQNRTHAPICFHPLRLHHARGRSHEAFRKRRACRTRPHMYVRAAAAPSRARLRVAPPGSACSRRLCPAVCRRDRAHAAAARGNPDESVAADASGDIARRLAGTRQMEMWGLWVFRAARSRAGLGAGDLSVRAEGRWVDDGR